MSDQTPLQLSFENLRVLDRLNGPYPDMPESVLVLGAGELGLSVLEALARHSRSPHTKITVLLRQATLDSAAPDSKKLIQSLRAIGVDTDGANVVDASAADLAAVFSKYDTVVSCNGIDLPIGTQIKITVAALEAGVKRFLPWEFGMDYDACGEGRALELFDEKLQVRKMLRHQDKTEWVIVSTGVPMNFLLRPEFGVVDLKSATVRALGSWENEITTTALIDIGRVTADVILDPRDIKNQVVYAAGDTVSFAGLADILTRHFGTEFRRELWDPQALRQQMEEDPKSSNTMTKYREIFAHGRGVSWDKAKSINAQRGMEMVDLQECLNRTDTQGFGTGGPRGLT